MDILKYGPDVKVLGPPSLVRQVAGRVQETAAHYEVDPATKKAPADDGGDADG